jgi:hypothetical protein
MGDTGSQPDEAKARQLNGKIETAAIENREKRCGKAKNVIFLGLTLSLPYRVGCIHTPERKKLHRDAELARCPIEGTGALKDVFSEESNLQILF